MTRAYTDRAVVPLIDRFMQKVSPEPNSGCWLWDGAVDSQGYGQIKGGRRVEKMRWAHRLSYELHHGPIGGLQVLHRCDVPICVNPDHLFLGTNADNMADMKAKGRARSGWTTTKGHKGAKLTPDMVREIRASTDTTTACGKRYGVAQAHISAVRLRKVWRHVV